MAEEVETTDAINEVSETGNSTDEYAYLDLGGFSSEKFKIELRGLPKFYGIAELKKLLNHKLSLNASKVKRPKTGSHWLYVCFQNEEDRTKAITALNGFSWKGKIIHAEVALPAPDPLVRKRKQAESIEVSSKKKKEDDNRSQEERLRDVTTPYWNTPYEEQLKLKEAEIRDMLMNFDNEVWKVNNDRRADIEAKRKLYDGLSFELMPIERSPVIDGYRNKCEFTVGFDEETKEPTVGFRLGGYATGSVAVAPIQTQVHISEASKKAVLIFQEFVRKSPLPPFSPADYTGYWRHLTVRHSSFSGEVMLIIALNPQKLSVEELSKIKDELAEHFSSEESVACGIKSVYYQLLRKKKTGEENALPVFVTGSTHIIDSILGLEFSISPQAFFQVNTAGANILYQKAIEMSQVNSESTLIDICCGTGTIGLCFAKHCKRVFGLELVAEAVRDARDNARRNCALNAAFFCGRAEEALHSVLARARDEPRLVAVVDPPRAGLHMRAITLLRNTEQVHRLVYISCSPASAVKNFVDLCRPVSKTLRGEPFVPVRVVPVDMFPHTKHVELAILFEREPLPDIELPPEDEINEAVTDNPVTVKVETTDTTITLPENVNVKVETTDTTITLPENVNAKVETTDTTITLPENVNAKVETTDTTITLPENVNESTDAVANGNESGANENQPSTE